MITRLADRWRKGRRTLLRRNDWDDGWIHAESKCADELTAALPKWTRITDDPATWPENGQKVIISQSHTSSPISFSWHGCAVMFNGVNGYFWRPLCDLDFPPEEQS